MDLLRVFQHFIIDSCDSSQSEFRKIDYMIELLRYLIHSKQRLICLRPRKPQGWRWSRKRISSRCEWSEARLHVVQWISRAMFSAFSMKIKSIELCKCVMHRRCFFFRFAIVIVLTQFPHPPSVINTKKIVDAKVENGKIVVRWLILFHLAVHIFAHVLEPFRWRHCVPILPAERLHVASPFPQHMHSLTFGTTFSRSSVNVLVTSACCCRCDCLHAARMKSEIPIFSSTYFSLVVAPKKNIFSQMYTYPVYPICNNIIEGFLGWHLQWRLGDVTAPAM